MTLNGFTWQIPNSVVRFRYHNGDLRANEEAEVIVPTLPHGSGHATRDIAFSLDSTTMFISVGSASNDAESMATFDASAPREWMPFLRQRIKSLLLGRPSTEEVERADVLAFRPNGEGRRVYASGIRNCVGMAVNSTTGDLGAQPMSVTVWRRSSTRLYNTRARRRLLRLALVHIGVHEDPLHVGARPDLKNEVIVPDILIQPHSASLQITFYTGEQFPSEYNGNVFAAEHGSWNQPNAQAIRSFAVS